MIHIPFYSIKWYYASLAQLAERVTLNLKVVGSKPARGYHFFIFFLLVMLVRLDTIMLVRLDTIMLVMLDTK